MGTSIIARGAQWPENSLSIFQIFIFSSFAYIFSSPVNSMAPTFQSQSAVGLHAFCDNPLGIPLGKSHLLLDAVIVLPVWPGQWVDGLVLCLLLTNQIAV